MCNHTERIGTLVAATIFVSALAMPADATAQSGKIVCWKDAAGKVIGCGDTVPPEFQNRGTTQLDSQGVTRKTTESAEETARRRERERELARLKSEDERKNVDQRRQDAALLDTYTNEKEIDLKRDRDLAALDLQIEQLNSALKNTTQRHAEAKSRMDRAEKSTKGVTPAHKDDLAQAAIEKQRLEKAIEARQKDRDELRQRFAEQKKRFTELRSAQAAAKK